ncbi:uncharacterized protein [Clinocottus analis]|uniref:uncharacterized protein isoform X2 n=1 Tax=Clinocottus analis TaxID=304258 RepID=UPI0035BEC77F
MAGRGNKSHCLHDFPKFPLWIIEHVWAHKTMDIQDVVDPSRWPELDSQPLRLQDSWRLRVASAEVCSIVKNRDVERFERAMGFLDATFRLLPRLVAPIKHMKIMFGLKTMLVHDVHSRLCFQVIMRMLREGRGMVDTVLKTSQFFPRKLPQYQGQCSQHEMFLMRKNHLDFKALAQALAMDKAKLQDYIKMEEQYGERYAQKVEDRLLHYLQELETALPGDTYIDTILKKESPVTEEEKLLLEVIASGSADIASTLKKLLHCDAASCRPGSVLELETHRSRCVLRGGSSEARLGSLEAEREAAEDGLLLLKNDDVSHVSGSLKTVEEKEEVGPRSGGPSPPQFCSKHRRWVRSILQECPDECSEELLLRANASSSPPLFPSSSSASSSQDLTPSGIVPWPPGHQPHPLSQASTHLQASEQVNPKDQQRSPGLASDGSQTDPSSPRDTQPPVPLSPVVRLIDIAFVRVPLHYPVVSKKQAAPALRPQVLTSPPRRSPRSDGTMKDSTSDQPDTVATTAPPQEKTAPSSQRSSASCQPPTQRTFSKLSRKFRRACAPTRPSQALDGVSDTPLPEPLTKAPTTFCTPLPDSNVWWPPVEDASTSITEGVRPGPESKTQRPGRAVFTAASASTAASSVSTACLAVRSKTSRVRRATLTSTQSSPALLLQSKRLQPYVSLTRLSAQECCRATKPRSSTGCVEAVVQAGSDEEEEEDDADSSFDVNTLYSDGSSGSDSEDTLHCDPEYKPRFKKRRLLSE